MKQIFEDKLIQLVISDGYSKAYYKASEYTLFLEDIHGWVDPRISYQYITPEGETYWEKQ